MSSTATLPEGAKHNHPETCAVCRDRDETIETLRERAEAAEKRATEESERLAAQADYSGMLQRGIELTASGEPLPDEVADAIPHHAPKLARLRDELASAEKQVHTWHGKYDEACELIIKDPDQNLTELLQGQAKEVTRLRDENEKLKRMQELGITEQDIAETMPPKPEGA